ncbi:MAG TPA: periplasmic heavy metal sensor [Thermoanaerobaculia bacterium]
MKWLMIIALAVLPSIAVAEEDPFARYLFPPELIMAHSQDLGLQEKQRETIKSEVQKAQSKFFDLQWQAKEEGDKMVKLLQQSPADEGRILEQADRIMSLEREIKRTHLTMLIRLRNLLSAEQQAKLQQFK